MQLYNITFAKSAVKELESFNKIDIERIVYKIELLAINPRPNGCKKLQGSNKLWRIRSGDYRILYSIIDDNYIVDIIAIKHRKDVYK